MIAFLARRVLVRQRARTLLTALGLAVTTALLYDMALLSRGLRASLDAVLRDMGYELRVLPKGGLPFSSEAVIPRAGELARDIERTPGVERVVPLWATTVYLARDGRPVSSFGLGIDPVAQPIYRVTAGRAPRQAGDGILGAVLNRTLADSLDVNVGDTLVAGTSLDPAGRGIAAPSPVVVTGLADFRLDAHRQRSIAFAPADLARLAGRDDDPAAFLLGRLAPGASAAKVVEALRAAHADVDTYALDELLAQVRGQLSYFQQFSLILGTVSLLVTFLLVLTLVTLSVNERQGEFAILRALGVRSPRIVLLVLVEGIALALLAIGPGLLLGSVASRALDRILRESPGLPADVSFFVFTPASLVTTVLLVVGTAAVAGLYPAWLAARTNVAAVLHREAA